MVWQVVWEANDETYGDRAAAMTAAGILSRSVPLVQVLYRGVEVATFRAGLAVAA